MTVLSHSPTSQRPLFNVLPYILLPADHFAAPSYAYLGMGEGDVLLSDRLGERDLDSERAGDTLRVDGVGEGDLEPCCEAERCRSRGPPLSPVGGCSVIMGTRVGLIGLSFAAASEANQSGSCMDN